MNFISGSKIRSPRNCFAGASATLLGLFFIACNSGRSVPSPSAASPWTVTSPAKPASSSSVHPQITARAESSAPVAKTLLCKGTLSDAEGKDPASNSGEEIEVQVTEADYNRTTPLYQNKDLKIELESHLGVIQLVAYYGKFNVIVGKTKTSSDFIEMTNNSDVYLSTVSCHSRILSSEDPPATAPERSTTWNCKGTVRDAEMARILDVERSVQVTANDADIQKGVPIVGNSYIGLVFTSDHGKVGVKTHKKSYFPIIGDSDYYSKTVKQSWAIPSTHQFSAFFKYGDQWEFEVECLRQRQSPSEN